MAKLTYLIGDATRPIGDGPKVICHCVNDIGHFGSGFAKAVMSRWPIVRKSYMNWHSAGVTSLEGIVANFELGNTQFVRVEPTMWVANIIGQHRTIAVGEKTPVRYGSIESGLKIVAAFCQAEKASVVMPRMGSGLARGKWETIEGIVQKTLVDGGIDVTVYDLS
jgi:O-acetyl-ADP-ribose deacetylase (regulator of RNase III)